MKIRLSGFDGVPVVYALTQCRKTVYVGSTCNVGQRVRTHRAEKRIRFDGVRILGVFHSREEAQAAEEVRLQFDQPRYNRTTQTKAGYELGLRQSITLRLRVETIECAMRMAIEDGEPLHHIVWLAIKNEQRRRVARSKKGTS